MEQWIILRDRRFHIIDIDAGKSKPIHLVFIPNTLTFLVPYNESGQVSKELFLEKFIDSLDFVLSQTLQPGYRIGIGGYADNMTTIHPQYKHASAALKITALTEPDKKIIAFRDICFEHLILNIPESKKTHYIDHIIGSIIHSDQDKHTWIQTLETYFENNQSLKKQPTHYSFIAIRFSFV